MIAIGDPWVCLVCHCLEQLRIVFSEGLTGDLVPYLRRVLRDSKGLWASLDPAARGAGEEKDGGEARGEDGRI